MALEDCLGPYVLKGLAVTVGKPKLKLKLSTILSAAIFDAEYGDWPTIGCCSFIGNSWAE